MRNKYYKSNYYFSSYSVNNDYTHSTIENARHHKDMMEQIANDVVEQALDDYTINFQSIIEEAMYNAYKEAINDFMTAIEYDITSSVSVAIDGCKEIFYDEKTQKIISDRIIQEIWNKLNKKH